MVDLLVEHVDELAFLWTQRVSGLASPRYTVRAFLALEDRIQGHLDGIAAVGERAIPVLAKRIDSDDADLIFASTFALVRLQSVQADTIVVNRLGTADGTVLSAMARALSMGPPGGPIRELRALATPERPTLWLTVIHASAFHSASRPTADAIAACLTSDAPTDRALAWRIARNCGLSFDAKTYAAALRDDPIVRADALEAAAWTGVTGVLSIARAAATTPTKDNLDAMRLLAILGEPADVSALARIAATTDVGPKRFELVAAYGNPALAPILIEGMMSDNKRDAVAAADAYVRLTGADLGPGEPVTLPPEDGSEPDEFEKEFLDEGTLPDPAKARAHWDRVGPQLSGLTRVAHGRDISTSIPADAYSWLDMQSRYEWWMRARFRGTWPGTPMQLEVFPQR